MREDVHTKLFHSDELKIIPLHLQTLAAEVASPEYKLHLGKYTLDCRGK